MLFASSSGGSQHQHQATASTDLLGSGGFALGNGFGNDVSNLAAASSGTSFDLSDFPSLGGGGGGAAGGATGSGNGLAAALREQQQLLAHQQMLQGANSGVSGKGGGSNLYMLAMTGSNGNFNMTTEDFPALGGGQADGSGNASGINVSSLLGNSSSVQPGSSNENAIYGGGLDSGSSRLEGGAGLLGGAGLGGLGGLRNPGSSLSPATSGSAPAGAIGSSATTGSGAGSTAGSALSGDYGLLGLLGVIRMTDADRNSLALGTDLQMMGLNLGTTEQIYSTFSSPWSDGGAAKEPQYQVRQFAVFEYLR
jgi:CCR4-NOT transcription complex subunit 2